MAIPELNTLSEKTRGLIDSVLAQNSAWDWPWLFRQIKVRIREDLKAICGDNVATYHPNLASMFNFYLNDLNKFKPDSEELNELWGVLFAKDYSRMQMRKLEKEIDMSDQRLMSLCLVRLAFQPYGYIVCMEKTSTLRLQPWEISLAKPMKRNRYYIRASQAKAVIKNIRMLDCQNISADDVDKALEIVKQKNPDRCDRLIIDLTKC